MKSRIFLYWFGIIMVSFPHQSFLLPIGFPPEIQIPDQPESAGEYNLVPVSGSYSEITGGSLSSASGNDGAETIQLPFPFTFDSLVYTSARISVNGWIALGLNYSADGYVNNLADPQARPLLAPFWDDLYDDSGSEIRYETTGSAPDRVLVVQWKGVRWAGSTGTRQNFQVRLYESDNTIEFVYGVMANSTNTSASIGLVDPIGGNGHFLSVTPGDPPLTSSTSADNNITTINQLPTGTIYMFQPPCFNLWNGTTNTNWQNTGNWDCNLVPGSGENATIPSGQPNYPVVDTQVELGILEILDGAEVTIDGGEVNMVGLRLLGNLIVQNNEAITISGTTAAWDCDPATGTFLPGNGSVTFSGSGTATFTTSESFYHLEVQNGKSFDPGAHALHVLGTFTNGGTFWPSTETSSGNTFDGAVINQGVWRTRVSKQTFKDTFLNESSGTFNSSSDGDYGTQFNGNVTNAGTFNATTGGKLLVEGDWIQNGTFLHGSGKLILVGSGLQEVMSDSGVNQFYDLEIEPGSDVLIKNSMQILHNLVIDSGGSLDLDHEQLSVNELMNNEGKLVQTQPAPAGLSSEFLRIQNENATADAYLGVEITPVLDMGETRVEILGNRMNGCTQNPDDALVHRCFFIRPESASDATIRFYYEAGELNNQTYNALKLWNFEPLWQQVGDSYTYGSTCSSGQIDCWMEAAGVENYSPFVLGSGDSPTSIIVKDMKVSKPGVAPALLIAMMLGYILLGSGLIIRKLNKKNLRVSG